jgi:hypothetical protein
MGKRMHWSWALGLIVGIGMAGSSLAQSQPAKAARKPYVVKGHVFKLPFKIDRKTVSSVRELQLWMRDEDGKWKFMDKAPPTASSFSCRVPRDGTYGFSIVTVDFRGVSKPSDVTREPADMIVIVRSDAGADAAPIETAGGEPNSARPTVTPTTPPAPRVPEARPTQAQLEVDATGPPLGKEIQPTSIKHQTFEKQPAVEEQMPVVRKTVPEPKPVVKPVDPPVEPVVSKTTKSAPMLPAATDPSQGTALLVNDPHVSIDYNINKVGPSGLGKVIVYITTDQGRTWQRLGEDTDRHSPADIVLPGEGVYGIRLVGINGNGIGGEAPVPGEQPSTIVEVDQTSPVVHHWKAGMTRHGQLEVRWHITDKNLGGEPVNLYYRARQGSPWKVLALKVKNGGAFRCTVPQDAQGELFVRLEATDLAGNVAHRELQSPILVDRVVPDLNVIGVTVNRVPGGEVTPVSGREDQ